MALANRRLLRKPLLRTLIVLIRLLMPSAGPLLTFRMIALRIPHSPTSPFWEPTVAQGGLSQVLPAHFSPFSAPFQPYFSAIW